MNPALVAARIEHACERQSISVSELCRRAQLPARNLISRMKSGEVSGRKHIPAIAAALGMTVEQLTTTYDIPRQESPDLAAARTHLEQARAANAILSEQLAAALAEVARLKNAMGPILQHHERVPADQTAPLVLPPGSTRAERKQIKALAWSRYVVVRSKTAETADESKEDAGTEPAKR